MQVASLVLGEHLVNTSSSGRRGILPLQVTPNEAFKTSCWADRPDTMTPDSREKVPEEPHLNKRTEGVSPLPSRSPLTGLPSQWGMLENCPSS